MPLSLRIALCLVLFPFVWFFWAAVFYVLGVPVFPFA